MLFKRLPINLLENMIAFCAERTRQTGSIKLIVKDGLDEPVLLYYLYKALNKVVVKTE